MDRKYIPVSLASFFYRKINWVPCYRCLRGQEMFWLGPSKPRKSEIEIYVPSVILRVVGREGEKEVYSVV